MKIQFKRGDPISTIASFFLCLFAFVAPLLILSEVGLNETTIIGTLLLVVVLYIQMSTFIKVENSKDKYKHIFEFTILPALSGIGGLVFYYLKNLG